ncbi:hypothetical protein APSETT444_006682 [Aspergillus pseudonomiae]
MNPDDLDDPDLRAAIAASLRDSSSHEDSSHNGRQHEVVDLTADSDDDVIPIFPKSNSVIGSETDGDETDSGEEDDDEDEDLKKAIELSMQGAIEDEHGSSRHHLPSADNNDSKASNTPLSSRAEAPDSTQAPSQTAGLLGMDRRQMEKERLARLNKRKAEESVSDDQRDAKHARTGTPPRSSGPVISVVDTSSGSNSSRTTPAGDNQPVQIPSPTPSVQFPNGVVKKTWAFGCPRQGDDIKIEEVLQKSDLQLAVLSSFMWEMEWLFSKLNTAKTRFCLVMQAKDESTSVFLIDLPKRSDKDSDFPRTAFYDELTYFLKASTLHENIIAKLSDYDFSKTAHIAFVHTMLTLCAGDDGSTEYVLRTTKSFPARSRSNPTQLIDKSTAEEWKDRFRVYFPSETTVNDTKGGPQSAGTICFQSRWYTGPKFPRQVLRDCERATKEPKLNCRNWECGVLIPVISRGDVVSEQNRSPNDESGTMLDIFEGIVPVPMRLPAPQYGPNRKPWFNSESGM